MTIQCKNSLFFFIILSLILSAGCKSMNKAQKGTLIGAAGGAVAGGVIGRISGNTALGVIIGAAVGGAVGAIIGHKMDKQAAEIKKRIPETNVHRYGEGIVVEFNDNILFAFDKSELTPRAAVSLDQLTGVLKEYPNTNIEIQGHTDNVGGSSYNLGLSKRRAKSVKTYLSKKGINTSRLATVGYGEIAPIYGNDNKDGQAGNRRVDFLITANEKMIADAKKEAANK